LTEELEESEVMAVYEDYKFVSGAELGELGLSHLVGTPLLRAHMHGHFIDIRLYRKAKALAAPFSLTTFKKKRLREKLDEGADNRVKLKVRRSWSTFDRRDF
jgi:ribosome biogenesis protein ENP2